MRQIITLDKPTTKLGMFDPAPGGVFLRTDIVEHRVLRDLWDSSNGLFWTVNMVDFSGDAKGFKLFPNHAKRLFKLNNGYQSLMDSGVVGIYNHLALLTNSNEVALSYQQIAFMETIHATSYSDGLLQMFGHEATSVIDIVYDDPVVRSRLSSEIDFSDAVIADPSIENIYKAIVATYLLEQIKFPFSFFVTFSLNKAYNNGINGFSQLISRIATDELEIHVPTNKYIIRDMINYYTLDKQVIVDMANDILVQELEWNKYLLQDGPIPGYNEQIGEYFIKYYHAKALRNLGCDYTPVASNDTIDWFNHYRNPDNKQVSQQEQSSTQYQKGVMLNDLHKFNS